MKKEKRLKNKKIVKSMILSIIMLILFMVQLYGVTVQNVKASGKATKTYEYGFNINDTGRWTGKAYRQIKICPLSSSKLKITYHYLNGNKKDETYTASKVSTYDYEYSPKIYYFKPGEKEKFLIILKKAWWYFMEEKRENHIILRSYPQKKKQP